MRALTPWACRRTFFAESMHMVSISLLTSSLWLSLSSHFSFFPKVLNHSIDARCLSMTRCVFFLLFFPDFGSSPHLFPRFITHLLLLSLQLLPRLLTLSTLSILPLSILFTQYYTISYTLPISPSHTSLIPSSSLLSALSHRFLLIIYRNCLI